MNRARLVLLFIVTLFTSACMTTDKSEENADKQEKISISGNVSNHESVQSPPDSKLYIRLNNISLADAPSINIAEQVFDLSKHSLPLQYQFSIPKDSLKPKETYAVRAKIIGADGGMLWYPLCQLRSETWQKKPAWVWERSPVSSTRVPR